MCLAVPARIESIEAGMAVAEIGGIRCNVSLRLTPGVGVGDYILLHTGYAICIVDRKEAEETLEILRKMTIQEAGVE